MNQLIIPHQLYQWLSTLGILQATPQNPSIEFIQIPEPFNTYFMNGILFAKIALQLQKILEISANIKNGEVFQDDNNIESRKFNWLIIQQSFQKLNFYIDEELLEQAIQGEVSAVSAIIQEIYKQFVRFFYEKKSKHDINTLKHELSLCHPKKQQQPKKLQQERIVDLENLDISCQVNEITSILEFFI